jgi:hypothetical protein
MNEFIEKERRKKKQGKEKTKQNNLLSSPE